MKISSVSTCFVLISKQKFGTNLNLHQLLKIHNTIITLLMDNISFQLAILNLHVQMFCKILMLMKAILILKAILMNPAMETYVKAMKPMITKKIRYDRC